MVSAVLFLTAVYALLISVGALSSGDLQCAYEKMNEYFCDYVQAAYQMNVKGMSKLEKLKSKHRIGDDRRRVSDANQSILELLKKTELKGLLIAFKTALSEEVYAMLELKSHCSEGELGRTAKAQCEAASNDLGKAIEELIQALIELPIGHISTLSGAVTDAYMTFEDFYTRGNPEDSYSNEAVVAGTRVLNAVAYQFEVE
ncbi:hypothetical protein Q1695_004367 [Nippostrongylus brasiliensis]|nr:hypothetical protein Q1695_004367 [Nippostrongylus brasiliensis]